MPNNTCDCPNPPGGKVVCEPHQMAICIIKNGEAIHRCLDPAPNLRPEEMLNWALRIITEDDERSIVKKITNDDLFLLSKGNFSDEENNVSFSLPERITKEVNHIMSDRNISNTDEDFNVNPF